MAQLAVYATHATNGVAALHTEILKRDVFSAWYELYPERFQNKTNGITQRRWLGLCNPELTELIRRRIGPDFLTDLYQLEKLKPLIDDAMCREFLQVKREKKRQLAEVILRREGVALSPDMLFDVQVKRLHEYKRQFLKRPVHPGALRPAQGRHAPGLHAHRLHFRREGRPRLRPGQGDHPLNQPDRGQGQRRPGRERADEGRVRAETTTAPTRRKSSPPPT
jgi:hypothetical protein